LQIAHICQRVTNTQDPWPEGIDYSPEQLSEGLDNLYRNCKRVEPLTKKEATFLKYPGRK
jgi:hypothetical protein